MGILCQLEAWGGQRALCCQPCPQHRLRDQSAQAGALSLFLAMPIALSGEVTGVSRRMNFPSCAAVHSYGSVPQPPVCC